MASHWDEGASKDARAAAVEIVSSAGPAVGLPEGEAAPPPESEAHPPTAARAMRAAVTGSRAERLTERG